MEDWFFILTVCDVFVRSRGFEKSFFVRLVKPIYKTTCLCKTSSRRYFCTLLIITLRWMFVQTDVVQQPSFRYWFCRLFFVNFVSFDVLFWCITHHTNCIVFLEEVQTKNMWRKFIGLCSNSYFIKYFVVFNHLKVHLFLHYIIYSSIDDSAQKRSQTVSPQK